MAIRGGHPSGSHLPLRSFLARSVEGVQPNTLRITQDQNTVGDSPKSTTRPMDTVSVPEMGASLLRSKARREDTKDPDGRLTYNAREKGDTVRAAKGDGPSIRRGPPLAPLGSDPRARKGISGQTGPAKTAVV